jgi:hypothetical protein
MNKVPVHPLACAPLSSIVSQLNKGELFMSVRIIAGVLFLAAISGCSDPKAASENNFRKAIQEYLDKSYPKCYVTTELPATIDWDISGVKNKLQALAKVGLVVESEGQVERPGFGSNKKIVTAPSFNLTEEGKKYFKQNVSETMGGKTLGGFCIGKATVKEIGQFSEPSEMFGQRISRVNYTYEVSDFPEWAKSPEVVGAIKDLKTDIESTTTPIKKLDVLVMTNHGWVHEKLFKQ